MSTFATVDEVQARLEFDLDQGDRGVVQGALEDLSDWARHYGRSTWTEDTAPDFIKRLVVRAAARYARNPDGFEQSRAGDETVIWNHASKTPGSAEFSDAEIKAIRSYVAPVGFGSIQMQAWGTTPQAKRLDQYAPVANGEPMPWVTEPW